MEISIYGGELLKIFPNGKQQPSAFQFDDPFVFNCFSRWERQRNRRIEPNDYTRDLKSVAGACGLSPDQIDQLLSSGFTHEEIEGYLYCGEV